MRKRFIILLEDASGEENEMMFDYIKEKKFGWWHYYKNSWLLTTHREIRARDVRDKIKEIYQNPGCLVIEIRGEKKNDTWSGFGPNSSKEEGMNMFKWLKKTWSK